MAARLVFSSARVEGPLKRLRRHFPRCIPASSFPLMSTCEAWTFLLDERKRHGKMMKKKVAKNHT